MDNITHGIIGGWIMDKVVGPTTHNNASRWQRNKLLILGGLTANLPDIDVIFDLFAPNQSPIDEFLTHRGITHSFFFAAIIALLLGRILTKTDKAKRPMRRWMLGVFLTIGIGHLIVDGMTTYGIRWFLPFDGTTYSFDNIFVIDLFYTIPLITLRLVMLFLKKNAARKILWAIGAAWILIYPLFSVATKQNANEVFTDSLQEQNMSVARLYTAPEPLQAFLWHGIAKVGAGYYETYYSIFDKDKNLEWRYIPSSTLLRNALKDKPDIQKVEGFAQGRTTYRNAGNGYIGIDVIKMGGVVGWTAPGSWFTFLVDTDGNVSGRETGGRMYSGSFSDIWNTHRSRVRGNK